MEPNKNSANVELEGLTTELSDQNSNEVSVGSEPENPIAPQSHRAELIQVDQAMESWRDSGYDLCAAAGEVIDNSLQAGAAQVRIKTIEVGLASGKRHSKSIQAIGFGDNGSGIPLDILPKCLTMGFSTRYNRRDGMGRFGVGAKLAALSQARRVDLYTRYSGTSQVYRIFVDLDMVIRGEQRYIEAAPVDGFPAEYVELMQGDSGEEYASGTLVVWSKVDRLEEGGKYESSVDEKKGELLKYVGRTYRRFIANGREIFLNRAKVDLFDPLFLLESPLFTSLLQDEWQADIIYSDFIEIDEQKIEVTVTLLPKLLRRVQGEGAWKGSAARFLALPIADNEGRVSILRQGREIYYNVVPWLLPAGGRNIDRFVGIEVAFPAALDEYFQVRNVKRGAEPVNKLKSELRKILEQPVRAARAEVRKYWGAVDGEKKKDSPQHEDALNAMQKVEQDAPAGLGGLDISEDKAEQIYEEAATDIGGSDPESIQELKEKIRRKGFTVIDGDWPGREMFEITHINAKVIFRLNRRHPFMRYVYQPLKELANGELGDCTSADVQSLARKVEAAVDLLFFSYAKAENQHRSPDEQYANLRTHWGNFVASGVDGLPK